MSDSRVQKPKPRAHSTAQRTPLVILASQSPARKRLLRRLGFKFRAIAPNLDEESYQKNIRSPRRLVETLAREKARHLARHHRGAIVIGSDQMLVLGRTIFGKPHTLQNAIRQLTQCSGKTVELLTAVTVIVPAKESRRDSTKRSSVKATLASRSTVTSISSSNEITFVNVTRMTFRRLSLEEITEYVRLDRPLQCAGSFMFERGGIRLFKSIETTDPTAIEGLPCLELQAVLYHALKA